MSQREVTIHVSVKVLLIMACWNDAVALTLGARISVEVVFFGNIHVLSSSSIPISGPPTELAVQELQSLPNRTFDVKLTTLYHKNIWSCDDTAADVSFLLAEYYYQRRTASNVTAFIFPSCIHQEGLEAAHLLKEWNDLAIMTSDSAAIYKTYRNTIRTTSLQVTPMMQTLGSFLRRFNWTRILTIADRTGRSGPTALLSLSVIKAAMPSFGITVDSVIIDTSVGQPFPELLTKIRNTARIMTYGGHALSFRKFMMAAHRAGMTDGNYVFLVMDLFDYPVAVFGNWTWQNYDEFDQEAFKAYQSVFVSRPSPTVVTEAAFEAREDLIRELIERSARDYNYTYEKGDRPSPDMLCQYAAVMILGQVLERIAFNITSWNAAQLTGPALASQIAGHTFHTKAGSMTFDDTGERVQTFDIQQFNHTSGHLQPVFRQNSKNPLRLDQIGAVMWLTGRPPPSRPVCGFSGLEGPCSVEEAYITQGGLAGTIVAITLIVTSASLRILRRKMRKELDPFQAHDLTADLQFVQLQRKKATVLRLCIPVVHDHDHLHQHNAVALPQI